MLRPQVFLVSQSSITGSDDGLLQQQVDEAGLGWNTGVGWGGVKSHGFCFVFPLRSWEMVLGFTLFGRESREQASFFLFFGLNIIQLLYVDVETERMKENWTYQCVLIEFLVPK